MRMIPAANESMLTLFKPTRSERQDVLAAWRQIDQLEADRRALDQRHAAVVQRLARLCRTELDEVQAR